MLRKRWIALAALLVSSTAVSSWAATVYQVQTKLATAGGTLKVANKATQTTVGATVFNNFTTAAAVPVTVNANTGYTISSIYKTGVKQTVADPATYSVNFFKAGGTTQSLIAYFAVQKSTVTSSVTGSGTVSPATATVDYNKSVTLTATPQFTNGYVDAITVDGAPYSFTVGAGSKSIVLTNVTANKAIAVTFKTVTVEAGNNKVGDVSAGTTLRGSVTGTGTLLWSQVSGPAAATIVNATSANATVTPAVAGTYTFKLTSSVNGAVLATDTVQLTAVTDTVAYLEGTCNGCHNPTTGNAPSDAFAGWSVSTHQANAVNCVTCHTDGAMPTPVNTNTVDATNFQVLNASAGTVGTNYCAKCHKYIAIAEHSATAKNDCSVCHGFDAHSLARTAVAGTVAGTHAGGAYGGNAQYVTQNITCVNCHVGAAAEILTDWAGSKHAAVEAGAWQTSSSHDWPVYSGGSCKRCHTGIGFVDTLKGTATVQASGQAGQVLACTTCHSNVATGAIHSEAGAYTLPYQIQGTDAAADVITVAGQSAICLPCHSGRGGGANVLTASLTAFNGRFPSHYLTAGGSLFSATGYHFAGQTYTTGVHKTIGDSGPCVTCHMNSAAAGKGHSFEAVAKTDGVITAINTAAACVSCHADMTAAKLEADKATFVAALNALKTALETKAGAFYKVEDGKFYTDATLTTAKGAWASYDQLGAAYNYWLFEHSEPAAYVHNRGYALKLIQDSVEFLNTAAVTGTYTVTAVNTAQAGFGHAATLTDCTACHTQALVPKPSLAAVHGTTGAAAVSAVSFAVSDADLVVSYNLKMDGVDAAGYTTVQRDYRYDGTNRTDLGTVTVATYNGNGNYSVTLPGAAANGNNRYLLRVANVLGTQAIVVGDYPASPANVEVSASSSCVDCHGTKTAGFHYSNPVGIKQCVVCHEAANTTYPRLATLVHGIHNSHNMPSGKFVLSAEDEFSVTYPTYMNNCSVCHQGADLTTVNNSTISYNNCMSCHENWNSFTGTGVYFAGIAHTGFDATTDCNSCHAFTVKNTAASMHNGLLSGRSGLLWNGEDFSVTEGAKTIATINSVEKSGNNLVVKWSATYDGVAADPCFGPSSATTPQPSWKNASNSFSLLRAWGDKDDWTNAGMGTAPGQPISTNLTFGTNTVCADNVATTTIPLTAAEKAKADDSKLGVALQGTPAIYNANINAVTRVRAPNAIKGVSFVNMSTASPVALFDNNRRQIVDSASCLKCHVGSMYQHGGNRTDNIDFCVTCHNEASSEQNVRFGDGVDASEAYDGKAGQTYGFKSLLHAVHSVGVNEAITMVYRTNGNYVWAGHDTVIPNYPLYDTFADGFGTDDDPLKTKPVGSGTAAIIYGSSSATGTGPVVVGEEPNKRVYRNHNLHSTTYPQALNNCAACHKTGTFGFPDAAKAVATTINAGTVGTATLNANLLDDTLQGPSAAACFSCHQGTMAPAAIHGNAGGFAPQTFGNGRADVPAESCNSCHQ